MKCEKITLFVMNKKKINLRRQKCVFKMQI